jgi:type IV secretion system protein VirD4
MDHNETVFMKHALGNEAMIRSLSGAQKGTVPFNWKELRNRPTTVYVILPVRYLMPMARWLRLCIASALTELLVEERRGLPVFLLMDEFAALGHLSIIEATMSLSAGMGLTMLPVLQDVGQLKEIYGGRAYAVLHVDGGIPDVSAASRHDVGGNGQRPV